MHRVYVCLSQALLVHEGVEGANQLEWGLPCHSLVLSGRSHVFAASQHDAECTKSEKTKGGKRLVRLPMDEEAATFFLKYCYGTLTIFLGLPWTAAVLVARVSNMLDMPGEAQQTCAPPLLMSSHQNQLHVSPTDKTEILVASIFVECLCLLTVNNLISL